LPAEGFWQLVLFVGEAVDDGLWCDNGTEFAGLEVALAIRG
jgi:hypothetical protein